MAGNLVTWDLTPRQREFWDLREGGKRVCAFIGGIRAGKTWLGARRFLADLMKSGGLGWCVTPTYTMMGPARRTFEECLPAGIIEEKRETPFPWYRLRWGPRKVEVEFRTAERPDNLRGPSLSALWVDEGAQLDDQVLVEGGVVRRRCEAWDILIGRVLDTRGPVLVTTTPKGRNWLYEEFLVRPGSDYGIVVARTDENPTLDAEAVKDLHRRYSGVGGRQELDAEFVSGEGIFFAEWERSLHVCDPFPLPPSWRLFGAMDDGYTAPFSFGLYAQDPEGTLYRTGEIYGPGKVTATKARDIAALVGDRRLHSIVCDPSMWAKKSDSGESTAEVLPRDLRKLMGRFTPPLVRGSNSRVEGWRRFREWLSPVEGLDGVLRARFQVFATCGHFLRTVPGLIVDEHNVEDVGTHGEDHCGDEARYLLMNRPRPSVPSLSTPEPYTGAWFMRQFTKRRIGKKYIQPEGRDAPI